MREQTDRTNFEIHINCVLNDVRYLPTNDISQRLGDVQTIDKACTQMVEVRSHIHHDIDAYIRRKMYKCCCVLSTLFFSFCFWALVMACEINAREFNILFIRI